MEKKTTDKKFFFYNANTNLNNHEDNTSKPYYVVSASFQELFLPEIKSNSYPNTLASLTSNSSQNPSMHCQEHLLQIKNFSSIPKPQQKANYAELNDKNL